MSAKLSLKARKSNYKGEESDKNIAQRVFDITTKFIQPIDVVALGINQVSEISLPVRDVYQSLVSFPNIPADYRGVATVKKWVDLLDTKKVSDCLTDEEIRELKYDFEIALQDFRDKVLH